MDELSPHAQQVVTMTMILVSQAARYVIDQPNALEVQIDVKMGRPTLILRVPESDMGNLIGRQARTAEALRTLTDALSARLNARMALLIEASL